MIRRCGTNFLGRDIVSNLNRAGQFRATIIDTGISFAPSAAVAWTPRFRINDELRAGEWADVSGEYLEITGYFYFLKTGGVPNEQQIQFLKDAVGWDGADLDWLQDGKMPDCQITTDFEEYDGKTRLKVQWINAYDSTGGSVTKAPADKMRQLKASVGAKLRGLSSGTSRPPAEHPAAAKAPADAPAPPAAAPTAAVSTLDTAWAAFQSKKAELAATDDFINRSWFHIIEQITGMKDTAGLTPAQWAEIEHKGVDMIPDPAEDEDLPF